MIKESKLLEYAARMRDANAKGKMCAVPILHEVGKAAIEGVYLRQQSYAMEASNILLVKKVRDLNAELEKQSTEEHGKAAFFIYGCFIGAAIGLGLALIVGF